jgi:enoyl-CoA hydratase/carnithine racemase
VQVAIDLTEVVDGKAHMAHVAIDAVHQRQGLLGRPAGGGQQAAVGIADRHVDNVAGLAPAVEDVAQRCIVAGRQRYGDGRLVGQFDGLDAGFQLFAEMMLDQAYAVADQQRQHHRLDDDAGEQ